MWQIVFMTTLAAYSGNAVHEFERQRFIGTWEMTAASCDGETLHEYENAPFSAELGSKVCFSTGTYRVLDDQWRLDSLTDFGWDIPRCEPASIRVFWFQGIYEFKSNDELWICVSYHGQGVEGEEARRWRPPADFAVRKDHGHLLFVLKRRR
jgi:hypothetical protein